uniref:Uncharacterized protein n=1 Tax=Anguilla anguilla TaxID=7936 RepID=A0A0E9VRW6_ANGAN
MAFWWMNSACHRSRPHKMLIRGDTLNTFF